MVDDPLVQNPCYRLVVTQRHWGSLRYYTWCKDGVKRKQSQSALHSTWRTEDVFLEREKIKLLNKCRKKQPMHQIMLRDLKFLRYWWSCLTCSVSFCWFTLHETLILLSFCVFLEMVNCLNTIILKIISHYCFHINSSFVLSYYNITQNMYDTFFINRILGPITSDVMNTVTLFTWQ